MITGELSLQEHLEKAWGGSYSCLDSGEHSHTLTQWTTLSIGAQASYSRAIPVFLPVSSHLRPLCSLSVVTQNNIVIQSSFILKEYKIYETNIYVSGINKSKVKTLIVIQLIYELIGRVCLDLNQTRKCQKNFSTSS